MAAAGVKYRKTRHDTGFGGWCNVAPRRLAWDEINSFRNGSEQKENVWFYFFTRKYMKWIVWCSFWGKNQFTFSRHPCLVWQGHQNRIWNYKKNASYAGTFVHWKQILHRMKLLNCFYWNEWQSKLTIFNRLVLVN